MPLRLDLPGDTPPLLYRRTSFLKRTRSGRPVPLPVSELKDECVAISAPDPIFPDYAKVPNELLDRIIQLYIQAAVEKGINKRWSQKFVFNKYIKDSVLVSRDFRFLILRHFFSRLFFESKDDSKDLLDYLAMVEACYRTGQGFSFAGYAWTRSLYCPSFLMAANAKSLDLLTSLRDLRVDFMHSNIMLQRSCCENLFKVLSASPVVCNLTSLTLTALPRIDLHILKSIALIMPGLTRLYVSSTDGLDLDCCPECYEESSTRIFHSPVPIQFPSVLDMAQLFGSLLAPLEQLTHLYLGIFLSNQVLLDIHAFHDRGDSPGIKSVNSSTFEAIHECHICEMCARASTKQSELLGSLVLAHHVKSLRYIGWSSCFMMNLADGQAGADKENFVEAEWKEDDMNTLKLSHKVPKDFTCCLQDDINPFNDSFRSKTVLAIDNTGQKIRVLRVV